MGEVTDSRAADVLERMRMAWPLATDEGPALDHAIARLREPAGVGGLVAQLRRELSEDKGWDYTEYEKGRIAEKERCIALLEALARCNGGAA